MAGAAPLPMRRHRFQDLSLPSQPRDRSRPLREILGDEGIGPAPGSGSSAGRRTRTGPLMEVPAFLVDALRELTGPGGLVENAADLLIDPADGLRVDQRGRPARGVGGRRLRDVERRPAPADGPPSPGMTEREAVRLLGWDGSPLSAT